MQIMTSDNDVRCFLCGKQLQFLSECEKQQHVNACLDASSSSKENVHSSKSGNSVIPLPDFSQFRCGEMVQKLTATNEIFADKLTKKKNVKIIPVDGQAAKTPVPRKPRTPKLSTCKNTENLSKVDVEFSKLSQANKLEFLKAQLSIICPTIEDKSKFMKCLDNSEIVVNATIKSNDSISDAVEVDHVTSESTTFISTKPTDAKATSLANLSTLRLELGEVISKEADLRAKEKRLRANIKKIQRTIQSTGAFQLEGAETNPVITALEYLFPTSNTSDYQLMGDDISSEEMQCMALKRPLWLISTQYGEDFERNATKRRISVTRDAILYSEWRDCESAVDVSVDSIDAVNNNRDDDDNGDPAELNEVKVETNAEAKLGFMSLFSQLIGELDEEDRHVDELNDVNNMLSTSESIYHRFNELFVAALNSSDKSQPSNIMDLSNSSFMKLFDSVPPELQATLSLLVSQITDEKLLQRLMNGSGEDENSLTLQLMEFFSQLPFQLSWSAVFPLVVISLLMQHNNTFSNAHSLPPPTVLPPPPPPSSSTSSSVIVDAVFNSNISASLIAYEEDHIQSTAEVEVVSLLSPSPNKRPYFAKVDNNANMEDDDEVKGLEGEGGLVNEMKFSQQCPSPAIMPTAAINITSTVNHCHGEVIVLCDDSPSPQEPPPLSVEHVVNENDYYWDYPMDVDVYTNTSHAVDVYSFDEVDDLKDDDAVHITNISSSSCTSSSSNHSKEYCHARDSEERNSVCEEGLVTSACLLAESEPLFESMSISELQEHCKKYGLKTESKAKMANILRALWQRMHRTPSQKKENNTPVLSQTNSMLPMLTQEGLFHYIQQHDTLYERVLLYHPIELDPLLVELKLCFDKITKPKVLQMLDALNVFVSMSSSFGRQKKKK